MATLYNIGDSVYFVFPMSFANVTNLAVLGSLDEDELLQYIHPGTITAAFPLNKEYYLSFKDGSAKYVPEHCIAKDLTELEGRILEWRIRTLDKSIEKYTHFKEKTQELLNYIYDVDESLRKKPKE